MNIPKFSKNKNAYTLALCEGRHTMPAEVQGSIFPAEAVARPKRRREYNDQKQ